MMKKYLNKKLSLNKTTISRLNSIQMGRVYGAQGNETLEEADIPTSGNYGGTTPADKATYVSICRLCGTLTYKCVTFDQIC